jgi:predicted DNA binding CopG/RHH family protein
VLYGSNGDEGERLMIKKIKYTSEPLEMEVIEDFLPPPEDLVLKEDTVKVTIGLSKPTVEFFKARAKRNHTQYQKMIRRLLDLYASRYR